MKKTKKKLPGFKGFKVCQQCGNLARLQSTRHAEAFASVAIENPELARLVCACDW